MGLQRIRHDWTTKPPLPSLLYCFFSLEKLSAAHHHLLISLHHMPCVQYHWSFSELLKDTRVWNGSLHCVSCSVVSDSVTLWTIARQGLLSMGSSRKEYWSGLPFPSPGDSFLTQGSKPGLPHCRQCLCHLSHQGSPNGHLHSFLHHFFFLLC